MLDYSFFKASSAATYIYTLMDDHFPNGRLWEFFPIKINLCPSAGHRSTSIEIPLQKLSLHFHNFIISSRPNLDIISCKELLCTPHNHNMAAVEKVELENWEVEDRTTNNS